MSVDDPVQPPEEGGQGGEESQESSAPYAEYLNRLPEEVRGDVEPVFRDWDASTTRKFQEAAEYKRGWEPFEQLGVNERDPAEIEWALQVADAASQNPAEFQKWVNGEYAQQHGLTPAEQQQIEQQFVDPDVQSMLDERLGPITGQIQQFAEWQASQEQYAREQQAMTEIRSTMDALKKEHPQEFNEAMIEKLLPQYIESDPQNAVKLAFQDWQSIRSQIEKDTLQGKADTPPGAESGGAASGTPDPPPKGEALKYAAQQALEQLRAANRS